MLTGFTRKLTAHHFALGTIDGQVTMEIEIAGGIHTVSIRDPLTGVEIFSADCCTYPPRDRMSHWMDSAFRDSGPKVLKDRDYNRAPKLRLVASSESVGTVTVEIDGRDTPLIFDCTLWHRLWCFVLQAEETAAAEMSVEPNQANTP